MRCLAEGLARSGRGAVAPLLATALAGCALQPAAPPAGRQYDGLYAGETTLTRGGGYLCGVPDLPRMLTVTDGRFEYPFQQQPPSLTSLIAVQIAADGTFDRSTTYYMFVGGPRYEFVNRWVTVRGRIVGNTLEATESDPRCTRQSTLRRR